jgi:hypothetical protein
MEVRSFGLMPVLKHILETPVHGGKWAVTFVLFKA